MAAAEDDVQDEQETERETSWRTAGTMSWTWRATVGARPFREAMETAGAVSNSCRLEISSAGVHVAGIDPANVACVDLTRDCVEDEALKGLRAGLDPAALASVIPDEPIDGEYTLLVQHGMSDQGDMLVVDDGDGHSCEVRLQHPEAVRKPPEEPPIPDDGVDVYLDAPYVRGVLWALGDTECDLIRFQTADGAINFAAKEHSDDGWRYDWEIPAPGIEEVHEGRYTGSFLAEIATALRPDEPVRLRFGSETPLRFDQDNQAFAVAPRLTSKSDDEDGGEA